MPPEPFRRDVLAGSLGLVTSVSGCLTFTGDADQSPTTASDRVSPTPEPDEGDDVGSPAESTEPKPTVDSVWVSDSVVHVVNVDGLTVADSPDGSQFVFATYEDDGDVDPDAFRLVVDGETYEPQSPTDVDFQTLARTIDRVGSDLALTGFVVPVREDVREATLGYGETGLAHELSAEARERLTADPVFEVRTFSLPDSAVPNEPFVADLTVANVGDGRGTFRATAPAGTMLPTVVERTLDAGEERTFTEEIAIRSSGPGTNYGVTLSWADGELTRSIRIEGESTDDA